MKRHTFKDLQESPTVILGLVGVAAISLAVGLLISKGKTLEEKLASFMLDEEEEEKETEKARS